MQENKDSDERLSGRWRHTLRSGGKRDLIILRRATKNYFFSDPE